MQHPPALLLARSPALPSTAAASPADAPKPAAAAAAPAPTPASLSIHPTFLPSSTNPGSVLLIAEGTQFLVHRDVLVFASPFFDSLLTGDWRETMSETSTWPGDKLAALAAATANATPRPASPPLVLDSPSGETFVTTDDGATLDDGDAVGSTEVEIVVTPAEPSSSDGRQSRPVSFVEVMEDAGVELLDEPPGEDEPTSSAEPRKRIEARIHLREERAASVQDLCVSGTSILLTGSDSTGAIRISSCKVRKAVVCFIVVRRAAITFAASAALIDSLTAHTRSDLDERRGPAGDVFEGASGRSVADADRAVRHAALAEAGRFVPPPVGRRQAADRAEAGRGL